MPSRLDFSSELAKVGRDEIGALILILADEASIPPRRLKSQDTAFRAANICLFHPKPAKCSCCGCYSCYGSDGPSYITVDD